MNHLSLLVVLLLGLLCGQPAAAQMSMSAPPTPSAAPLTPQNTADMAEARDPISDKIIYLQNTWADIKYSADSKDRKLAALRMLEKEAARLTAENPARAEPKIWEAIILSTEAGLIKGLSALPKVKQAKKLLEEALGIDSRALEGSAHTSLGSLYYQVPGWPVGFGDNKKAEQHLKAALAINPDGIDPNFFYGDFLTKQKRYTEAVAALQHARAASPRAGRAVADSGRQREISEALATAQQEAAKEKKDNFN